MGQDVTVRTRSGSFKNDYVIESESNFNPTPPAIIKMSPPTLKAIQKFERAVVQQSVRTPTIGKIVLSISNEGQQPARDIWIQVIPQSDVRGLLFGNPRLIRILREGEHRDIEIPVRSTGAEIPRQVTFTIEVMEAGGYNLHPPLRAILYTQ